jgi:spore coat protein U-like protein
MKNLALLTIIVSATFVPFSAQAQTVNVAVGANIVAACTLTQTSIAFGTYTPTAPTALDATGSVSLSCTTGSIPNIAISTGANFASATRNMASGVNRLAYGVFLPSANTAAAACDYTTAYPTTNPGFVLTAAPDNLARSYNLCGRIPAGQVTAATGVYSDTVVASIAF